MYIRKIKYLVINTLGITICMVLTCVKGYNQDFIRREIDVNSFIQNLLPIQGDDINYNEVAENLIQLYATPLDLNTCTREELSATFLLNERQLNHFFEYRSQLGPFISIYELQAIVDFDLPTIYKILPFVGISSPNQKIWESISNPSDHYFLFRTEQLLETKRGSTPNAPKSRNGTLQKFEGSNLQWYARYRYSRSRDFSFGFTFEKDEGESFEWNPSKYKYGADFVSVHAQIQNKGKLKNLIIGDYQLQVGQGLIFAAGFSLGKGMETVYTVRRPTVGAKPYTSVTEAGFLRGISATYALHKKLSLTMIYSRTRRSGNLSEVQDDSTVQTVVSSLQTDGLHRIPNELQYRANTLEQNTGAHLWYNSTRGQLGVSFLYTHFDTPLKRASAIRNEYEFSGTDNLVVGCHGNYLWQNFNFFGEIARSKSSGIGAVAGMLASLSKRWDATTVFRHYDKNFHSFYANSFGENSRNINETGLYVGLKYTIHKKLKIGTYIDVYKFGWYKYLVDKQNSSGYDVLFQTTWTPSKKWALYGVIRHERKERNIPSNLSKQRFVSHTIRQNLILNAEYTPHKVISFRTRIQGSLFSYQDFPVDKGWLIFQEIAITWRKISISSRISSYNTDSYDARQYAVEKDVLYAISMPVYYERGFRNYILLRYTPYRKLDLWLRIARTTMPERDKIGSYVDEIDSSHRTELKFQLRYKL